MNCKKQQQAKIALVFTGSTEFTFLKYPRANDLQSNVCTMHSLLSGSTVIIDNQCSKVESGTCTDHSNHSNHSNHSTLYRGKAKGNHSQLLIVQPNLEQNTQS